MQEGRKHSIVTRVGQDTIHTLHNCGGETHHTSSLKPGFHSESSLVPRSFPKRWKEGMVSEQCFEATFLSDISCHIRFVSQATPFTERGKVWSCCNYRVVAEECNYQPLRLGNKMLISAKHVHDNGCDL